MSAYNTSLAARVRRIAARIALTVTGLVVFTAGSVYAISERAIRGTYDVPEHPLVVPTDSASIARGQHLATIRGCVDCHATDFGGTMILDDPAIGRLGGANLTSGRAGGPLTDRDWERAVRHGVRRDGKPLLVMPSIEFTGMSDEDLAAIVAYARSLPPSPTPTLPVQLGPVLRGLSVAGQVKLSADEVRHDRAHPRRVDVAPTAAYGEYLAQGCKGCHGDGFSGGKIPGAPPDWKPAANITPAGIGRYQLADFERLIRTGRRPDGSPIDSLMPWGILKYMTDTEIQALYAYLRTVPARPYGNR
ncbi:MAG: c-type cytochrome [Gemmatimonadaceae bacterium]|nr:c-type cytochrome [Gemmatimonadaceae bacterium]